MSTLKTHKYYIRMLSSICVFLIIVVTSFSNAVFAQSRTIYQRLDTPYYDLSNSAICGFDSTLTIVSGGSATASPSGVQVKNAQVIIGIAKTDNLGKAGALIGLMVGLAESGLKNYANSNVPISLSNPAKEAIGSDHDSVGVFQQRPSTAWSTFAPSGGDAAISNKDAVWQLMDPAYAAEAFFGSPSGSNAPGPLSKGLENKSGWESMQPWVAAQSVQASGTSDGSNYRRQLSAAQALLNQYWDTAPAIPLPVPINQGSSGSIISTEPSDTGCNSATSPVIGDTNCAINQPVFEGQYSQTQLAAIFGNPGTADSHSAMDANLVSVDFLGQTVQVNKLVAPCLRATALAIQTSGISYKITSMGCYRFDSNNGVSNIGLSSYHTYGAACDINPGTNPFQLCPPCSGPYDMPSGYVQAFNNHGFTWGGNWHTRKDYMHFEFHGINP